MSERATRIASWRHTAILVAVFLGIALAGGSARQSGAIAQPSTGSHVPLYLGVLASEWALVWYVRSGLGGGMRLRDLVGGRWSTPREVLMDGAVAAVVWFVWLRIQALVPGAGGAPALLPRTTVEAAVWLALALSAGFCEELVFRGYLQRQCLALTGNGVIAVLLQAIVFGIGHLYEGSSSVVRIVLFGVVYGLVAQWRRSLRPLMIAHAWSDIAGVIVLR